jgi:hypothetical protein
MTSVNQITQETCLTCLGGGEVSSERGISGCPDCDGTGKVGDVYLRTEHQLREIEARSARLSGEAAADVIWLVGELRRSRQALLKALTAAQDGNDGDDLIARIRFEANEALKIYRIEPGAK